MLGAAKGGDSVLDKFGELTESLAYALVVQPLDLDGDRWLAMAGAVIAMALIGSLAPDIDSPNSLAGRRVKRFSLPLGPHRGVTHTNWVLLGVLVLAFTVKAIPGVGSGMGASLYAFALGYAGHLIADGFSNAGRAPWWPLGRWTLGQGGVVIARGGGPRWYAVGQVGEYVIVGAFTALMLLVFMATRFTHLEVQ
jgi:membrane-bound metal-dependent hydrolase YbcI (DUF457 family)